MKSMKRMRTAAALALCLLLLLAACGQSGESAQSAAETPPPAPQTAAPAPTPTPNDPPLLREEKPETDAVFSPVGEGSDENWAVAAPETPEMPTLPEVELPEIDLPELGGGAWPDNEYTRRVPDPGFEVVSAQDADGTFEIAFSGAGKEQVKAYAELLQTRGFDRGVDVTDQSVSGMEIYMFSASDAEGYTVELAFTAGMCVLTIGK